MVEHDLAKVDTGVQFPSPAPVVKIPTNVGFYLLKMKDGALVNLMTCALAM
jgi:hypothetical protein